MANTRPDITIKPDQDNDLIALMCEQVAGRVNKVVAK